jgi:hypothetical protein
MDNKIEAKEVIAAIEARFEYESYDARNQPSEDYWRVEKIWWQQMKKDWGLI